MTAAVFERVRAHLLRHPTVAYRPVPLATAIREKDIRQVRAALRRLADAGEAVTCKVIKDGVEETEYRISCGGPTAIYRPVLHSMNDRPVRRSEVGGKFVAAEKPAPFRETCSRPSATTCGGSEPLPRAPSPESGTGEGETTGSRHGRLHQGTAPVRQQQIIEFLNAANRPVFPWEVIDHVRQTEPRVSDSAIQQIVCLLARRGDIARLAKRLNPRAYRGHATYRYATHEVAERVAEEERAADVPAIEQATKSPDRAAAQEGAAKKTGGPAFCFDETLGLKISTEGAVTALSPAMTRSLLGWLGGIAGVPLERLVS